MSSLSRSNQKGKKQRLGLKKEHRTPVVSHPAGLVVIAEIQSHKMS
jgi:hypothetical protein